MKLQKGVVHLSSVLDEQQQLKLLEDIESCTKWYKPTQARNAKSNFNKIIALDFQKQKDRIPDSFKSFSATASSLAHEIDESIPESYIPNYCTSFVYPQNAGKLTGHCDKVL
eukprot:TRINITY_DN3757_c0_g1_i1.p2 TRINITY_DN3757_c0_g1~~TRINITY_DN3757_c0_g1_i1.p2  ORF type:complete len:112 (+),score=18.08 TRINITY_DN3757_c0_g1_i1:25-360(+)